jgi:mannosylglycerate hydrolase
LFVDRISHLTTRLPLEIHLVTHTHWDREWYCTAEVFRQRLVDLVDELIETPPRQDDSFLLDGQTIVLEDYLAVRPDRRDRLESLLRDGRMEAGPWYVLSDELIPGGEALVRNLLVGRAVLAALGATSPPVLYCPDSFGHPAALPEIATGFGLPLIVLWRGYGSQRWPRGDVVRWRAPSGAQALVFHLPPDGYEFGSSLPTDEDAARDRWERIRATLAPRSTVGVTLLQNGADHHARQAGRDLAVKLIQELAEKGKDRVRASSMRAFADSLVERAAAQRLPTIAGELRDSYGYTWTLQGTFATRASQKRANAIAERSLVREAEPWHGIAWFAGSVTRQHHLRAAWKSLLAAHPHDTLCGTSTDEVAVAMDARLRAARAQANAITTGSIDDLLGRDPAAERDHRDDWQSVVVIRNDAVRPRGGVVIVDLVEKIADEPVGPGSARGPLIDDVVGDNSGTPNIPNGMQILESRVGRDRIESPRHYPDNDIVRVTTFALTVDELPAMSLTSFPSPGVSLPTPRERVRVSADEISNTVINCRFEKSGALTLESGGRGAAKVIRFEDLVDRGDLYTPSIGVEVGKATFVKQRVIHRGPLIGEVQQQWKLGASGDKRTAGRGEIAVSLRVTARSPALELFVTGVNTATSHRLRFGIATGVGGATVVADAAFGPIERIPLEITSAERKVEAAPPTAPLHRYVSLFSPKSGATVFSDGLAEYEVDGKGVVWITLVRAVGDLSRNDLAERPGHAGWPVDTPEAQSIGPFEGRFVLFMHGGRTPATLDEIEHEADRFLHPLRGFTYRSALHQPAQVTGPELTGTGLAFSTMKQSEDEQWLVLRCVNLLDREQKGRWTLPRSIREAKLARLDETPLTDIVIGGNQSVVEFTAARRAVVTILVR